jgi:N-succinyldiaminopimelate aminotransferase
MNPLFAGLPTTIFEVMSALARETGAINLGQGFPDDNGPEDVRRKAAEAVINESNQYPPMLGLPQLRRAVAEHYRRFQNVALDWEREVMVTSGGTEALAASLLALIEPGDEVVLIQPIYDAYLPLVRLAGGVPRFVKLSPPDWRLTTENLAEAFTPRTKVVVLNNPLNPTGTVFTRSELDVLASFVKRSGAIVVADEVWEHLTYDGRSHVSVLSLPELRDRAVKIGSAGKIFSLTGWKVGFACAAPDLLKTIGKAHQFLTFTTPPNLQLAVAYGLGKEDAYFASLKRDLAAKRDRFSAGLITAGFRPLPSEGTYFLNVDLGAMGQNDDVAFCERLIREAGVAAIPVSAFYAEAPVTTVARFCFAKSDATLGAAIERLTGFVRRLAAA